MVSSSTIRSLLALLLAVGCCRAMGVGSGAQDEASLADDAMGTPSQGHEDHLPSYHSALYNEWVDGVLAPFSTDLRHKATESSGLFLSAGRAIVHKLADHSTDSELFAATKALCSRPTSHYSAFLYLLRVKNTCLTDLEDDLQWVASSFSSSEDVAVRDQVSSQLLCKVLSPALSCFEPVLSHMVECVSDGGAVRGAVTSLNTLLGDYCANDAINITNNLMQAPAECVPEGVNFFLKYTGPAFLQHITAPRYDTYPCLYTKYILSVADVILKKYCAASTVLERVADIEAEFSTKAGCAGASKV